MKRNNLLWITSFVCLWACRTGPGQPRYSSAGQRSAVHLINERAGKQIYLEPCAGCHGPDGTSGIIGAANLQTLKSESETIRGRIYSGKGIMPAFEGKLSSEETDLVMDYIKTFQKK